MSDDLSNDVLSWKFRWELVAVANGLIKAGEKFFRKSK